MDPNVSLCAFRPTKEIHSPLFVFFLMRQHTLTFFLYIYRFDNWYLLSKILDSIFCMAGKLQVRSPMHSPFETWDLPKWWTRGILLISTKNIYMRVIQRIEVFTLLVNSTANVSKILSTVIYKICINLLLTTWHC